MLRIERITVDYTEDPAGVTRTPAFSWVLASDRRSTMQVSYHLEIALDKEFSHIVYEIREESECSVHHRFEDFSMRSLARYYWRVEVLDNHGEESLSIPLGDLLLKFLKVERKQQRSEAAG